MDHAGITVQPSLIRFFVVDFSRAKSDHFQFSCPGLYTAVENFEYSLDTIGRCFPKIVARFLKSEIYNTQNLFNWRKI
jgi:hypothetical protein